MVKNKTKKRTIEVSSVCGFEFNIEGEETSLILTGKNLKTDSFDIIESDLTEDGLNLMLDSIEDYCNKYRVKDQLENQFGKEKIYKYDENLQTEVKTKK